jgi:uncharacterized protein with von Willebrand factor type A (vWA) domain
MNAEELRKLFDLDRPLSPSPSSAEDSTSPFSSSSPPSAPSGNPTALQVDPWGLRRGSDLLRDSPRLQSFALDEYAIADFHTAAFEPEPQLLEDCQDPVRRGFLVELFQTPEYQALHAGTRLDEVSSEIATLHFAEQFSALRNAATTAEPEIATLKAVSRAVLAAREEVDQCREAITALGGGLGPGTPGSVDPKAIAQLFQRIRQDPTLRRICELAGRYRRLAQSSQRRKCAHGQDDLVGVTTSGDLAQLLPHELVRLGIPELELDTLRRLAERQCLARDYQSLEPVGKGPIVVVIDESGSMAGDKVQTAKALALALAWIARQQRRWCGLIAYSGDTGERLLSLPPARWDESELLDWLGAFLGGGSTLDVPIVELPWMVEQLWAPPGITDVLILTDAICSIPLELQQKFLAWKRLVSARVISLILADTAGDLAALSDEVHLVKSLEVTENALGSVLSI